MSKFTRPTFNVDDDDLERLQKEFFDTEQAPSAKVYRKAAPPSVGEKKRSLFAERLASSCQDSNTINMPSLEDSNNTMPPLEDTSMPSLEDGADQQDQETAYEPVIDPHPEPHVPVSKKMIDLTSMLGQVLGEIKEHNVESVTAPKFPDTISENKPARGQHNGFPKPVHRSEFKKRLEAQKLKKAAPPSQRLAAPPQVEESQPKQLDPVIDENENDQRIRAMSEAELEEARQEIMSTLSPESVALLMKGLKNSKKTTDHQQKKKHVTLEVAEDRSETKMKDEDEDVGDDLLKMKAKYFANVPLENEKLAWMDNRFMTSELKQQQQQQVEEDKKSVPTEAEKVYRQVRFDLQGNIIDPSVDLPRHKGLHHHGDEPDKAGYTLAELFYLTRSQVPSQRAMVLNIITRIIYAAKKNQDGSWPIVWTIFTGKEHAASIYLRSALDDRHLVVMVSTIKALSALVLDDNNNEAWENNLIHQVDSFNKFLGHVARPVLSQGATEFKRKGLNDKLTELVDRVRQQSGSEQDLEDDAALAERDLARGLVKMNILPRIRYLFASSDRNNSELIHSDSASVERLVRLLVHMAQSGQDICELIEEEELLDPVVQWGIQDTQWPMTSDTPQGNYPSVASVRLLTVMAQGSKKVAETIVDKAIGTLRFVLTSPEIATTANLKQRAYALQLETLKLVRILACYGFIVPTLEDLQEPVMDWLRASLRSADDENDVYASVRAATAIGLLEVLLHAAADPHKTTPAHAIDWHQPTAYLPAVLAVLRANRKQLHQVLYESALGYLGTWASYASLFPPPADMIREVWKAVFEEQDRDQIVSALTTNHGLLRYIQWLVAYASQTVCTDLSEAAQKALLSTPLMNLLQERCTQDLHSRYALWIWASHTSEQKWRSDDTLVQMSELQSGIRSKVQAAADLVETWLAQNLLQLCLSDQLPNDLKPFYFSAQPAQLTISKALFDHDGRPLKSLMYLCQPSQAEQDTSAFILSPIDALYHLDKSTLAQKSQASAVSIVSQTLNFADKSVKIDPNMAIVSLMKVFLIGDREGRQADMMSEREIFWDVPEVDDWLNKYCSYSTTLSCLENAWQASSQYIRQAKVPFYQFYQGFVAQYAAVSLGHHGFARLLVYLLSQIDVVDYRHLVLADYRDILPTLKVRQDELPSLTHSQLQALSDAGLYLLPVL
ncbi:RNA polymerase II-associated protein 1 [Choanephora cucurbitarum]|uniref:RNA polymerase II-associated protein 1 n=1 Tax=Choanephora cucurbitarum TaxID=101091 RepID=A0A1C7NMQ1_9FUNG|nr:RNA polymerase II-associated protein 1 [Choanephora cucurbitarum]